ncbi:MBOAT family O-acyltransferase [Namhaeicola litoreus]|uniref:MBOAT family O-acyltransferase n=1 Tax=Namhaeicola litoreus TaxID=1052145 RepID=A0ABW3Y5C7_9FLAO
MLFNSLDFAIFLPIVFILYWFVTNKNLKLQNLLVVAASYVFYGWWDWRFLALIIFSTLIDYYVGIGLSGIQTKSKRKILLWISLGVNLGFLGFFKYHNFFLDNFVAAFSFFGKNIDAQGMHIILPVGISFYTFQTMSYSIDVYRKKLEPTKDFIAFAAFVSFFPQLVAGPIERATNLLPQFLTKRSFSYDKAVDGMRQILWGLFKKMVIADNCAEFANEIFNNYENYSGSTLLLGAFFFAFQIYGDFSGYSDIAIGTSRLFGFNLMKNFSFPYFSRDIAEFWRRWHISLSTWFRDYLYIPLGGSKGNMQTKIRNILIVFLVSGFWHGANWTFIFWGFVNALYFIPLLLINKHRTNLSDISPGSIFARPKDIINIVFTFALTLFAWIFFRSPNLTVAFDFISNIFQKDLLTIPKMGTLTLVLILFFIVIEWFGRTDNYGIEKTFAKSNRMIRLVFYSLLISIIAILSPEKGSEFIYFQF